MYQKTRQQCVSIDKNFNTYILKCNLYLVVTWIGFNVSVVLNSAIEGQLRLPQIHKTQLKKNNKYRCNLKKQNSTWNKKKASLRLRRLVRPLLRKALIIYSKNSKNIFWFVMQPKIWCLRNVQIFIDLSYGVLIL